LAQQGVQEMPFVKTGLIKNRELLYQLDNCELLKKNN